MATAFPNRDIVSAAVELVTVYGFPVAQAKASAMASECANSAEPDVGDGVVMWEGVGAAITMLHARLV